jgi:hypothetical protein
MQANLDDVNFNFFFAISYSYLHVTKWLHFQTDVLLLQKMHLLLEQ